MIVQSTCICCGEKITHPDSEQHDFCDAGCEELYNSAKEPFKTCKRCGAVYETRKDFESLSFCGIQRSFSDKIPDQGLRNCPCGDTLAVPEED